MQSLSPPLSLAMVAWLGWACSAEVEAPAHPQTPPPAPAKVGPQRVILITVDTMRGDSLECPAAGSRLTPNICKLVKRGRRYTHAISPAPATLPALTSIFTYSQVSNEEPAELVAHFEERTTLAETLRARGLQTAAFTDHHGLGRSPASPVYPPSVVQRGFTVFENFGVDRTSLGAHEVTRAASDWLNQNGRQPYFLWVHYFDPHFNYRPDPELAERFGYSAERCGRITNGIDITALRQMGSELTTTEVACVRALHEAELFATDAAIGQFVSQIPNKRDTLLIFAADHGEEFLDRNRIGHEWTVYDELVRVPFLVVGPEVKPGIEPRVVSTTEIFSLATGDPVSFPGQVYTRTSHYYGKTPDISKVRQRPNEHALVSDDAKVVLHPSGKVELFDLTTDPGERNPSADGGPLLAALNEKMVSLRVTPSPPSDAAAAQDRATRERLKELGYIE